MKYSPILFLFFLLFSCQREEPATTLFTTLSAEHTGVHFTNQLQEGPDVNIVQYLYAYNGGGVAIGDIDNDGLPDLFFTANEESNQLYRNRGNFQFENVSAKAGVEGNGKWSSGVTMADVNADGWLDIYVCQVSGYQKMQGQNLLYINNADGTFSERASDYGIDHRGMSTQAAFFDYDGDHDLDLFLLCHSAHATDNYRDTSNRHVTDDVSGDKLFRNDGNRFTNVTEAAGIISSKIGYGLGLVIADLNKDGCPDIYVGNDFHENDYLYYNNCDGSFRENISESTAHNSTFTMGVDIADFDNDTRPDILALDMRPEDPEVLKNSVGADNWGIYEYKLRYGYHHQFARNMLQWNRGDLRRNGTTRFSEIGQLAGIEATDWSWSPLLADFDLDGWKDIVITNGILRRPNDLDYLKSVDRTHVHLGKDDALIYGNMPDGKVANYAFQNQKDLTFKKVSTEWGFDRVSCSNGAAYADLDNDGDLDLVMNNINEPTFVMRNNAVEMTGHRSLKVKLFGPKENPNGLGTRITIWVDGHLQYQEVTATRGFQSASDVNLLFGIGLAPKVDSMEVVWPDGRRQLKSDVSLEEPLALSYETAHPVGKSAAVLAKAAPIFQDVSDSLKLSYKHFENNYSDLNKEVLMPRLLSREGPPIAVGDVDGDGLNDFYVGGASGQGGALYVQTKEGAFASRQEDLWRQDVSFEDTDAAFFDADGDTDLDLYVAHGGNQWGERSAINRDHLYLNDGNGRFAQSANRLPPNTQQGACVRPHDVDGDGDVDLFVGNRVVHRSYGKSPSGFLLLNDGKGYFRDSAAALVPTLHSLGMVTDATWADVDGNGNKDLVVVGEWMAVTILLEKSGHYESHPVSDSEGWWNCVAAADLDADGDVDIVAGNLGWNSYLTAGTAYPVILHLKDVDQNGQVDPLLSYFPKGGKANGQPIAQPLHNLDELAGQIFSIKKRFSDYRSFSQQGFYDIFPETVLAESERKKAVTFASSVFINDGSGNFSARPLPREAQLAPVQKILCDDFDGDGKTDLVLGENLYDVPPLIGRLDAGYGLFLKGDGRGGFVPISPEESGLAVFGQVRDIEMVRAASGERLMVVGRNDAGVQVFGLKY